MSGLELYVDDIEGRLTAAVMEKGRLSDLYIDGGDMTGTWASIYLGKVTKIDNKLDAAIVDLGNGLSGFLPAKHVHFQDADASEARSGIGQLLKPGQMVMVQIKSEARKGSRHEQQKMPRLTTKIYIIGQFCVYCPIASRVTMSRRLTNESIIAFTAKLKNKGGWIIQQNADNAAEADILQETSLLEKEWDIICAARDASRDQPRMLRAGPNALYRALADRRCTGRGRGCGGDGCMGGPWLLRPGAVPASLCPSGGCPGRLPDDRHRTARPTRHRPLYGRCCGGHRV